MIANKPFLILDGQRDRVCATKPDLCAALEYAGARADQEFTVIRVIPSNGSVIGVEGGPQISSFYPSYSEFAQTFKYDAMLTNWKRKQRRKT